MDFNVRNNKFDACTFKNPMRKGRVSTPAKIACMLSKCNFLKLDDVLDIQLSNGFKTYDTEAVPPSLISGSWGNGTRRSMMKAGIIAYDKENKVYIKGRYFDNYIGFLKSTGVTLWA